MLWLQVVAPGLLAAAVTLLATPLVIRLSYGLRALDAPGGRKRHARTMPRLGGVAIVLGITTSIGLGFYLLSRNGMRTLPNSELAWFATATLLVFVLGLVDDLFGLPAMFKLLVQVIAASIIVKMGWQFAVLRLPIEGNLVLGVLAPVLSILWIVGVTNAINFVDGLDGLAAGIVAIIACSLMGLAILQNSPDVIILASAIVGANAGFLRHNWRPAKIYMGDSGSLTLGFLLATISLRSDPSLKASVAVAILVPLLALGLPVFDTLLVMWYRFLQGHRLMNRVARMLHADRAHLHHLLIDSQAERRVVMLTLYGAAGGFCLMALLVAASGSLWLGCAFLVIEFAAVVMIRRFGLMSEARQMVRSQVADLTDLESGVPGTNGGESLPSRTSQHRVGTVAKPAEQVTPAR